MNRPKKHPKAVGLPSRRRVVRIAAICFITLGVLVALAFQLYQSRIDQFFESMVAKTLLSTHESQVKEVQSVIRKVCGTLESVAAIYKSAAVSPESDWSVSYLQSISEWNNEFTVEYIPLSRLEPPAASTGQNADMRNRLLGGETVVSDVRFSHRTGARAFFSIEAPVEQNGTVIGVLRSVLESDLLLWVSPKQQDTLAKNYLIYQSGSVIQSEEAYLDGSRNLFDELAANGFDTDKIAALQSETQNETGAIVQLGAFEGGNVFAAVSPLGYNGWMLVSAANANHTANYSAAIVRNTVWLGIGLIGVLVLLFGVGARLYLKQQGRLRREQARYGSLSRFSDTILFEYDCKRDVITFTPNISEEFPLQHTQIARPFSGDYRFELLHPDDIPTLQAVFHAIPKMRDEEIRSIELRLLNIDGAYHWMHCQCLLLRGEKGEPLTLLGKLADIQKQKEKEQSLLKQSTLDAMTGVYNRTAIETQINRLLAENIPGFLLMIDLDNFKHVNDSLGHMAGDALLVQFVQALKDEFRKQDLIGRVGGDEFVVFMSGTANRNAASKKAAYLLQKIGTLSADSSVSASIGIAASPAHGRSYAALYTAADKAMYYAKQKGKNTMCFAPNTAK